MYYYLFTIYMVFLHKILHKITKYQDVGLLCFSMREQQIFKFLSWHKDTTFLHRYCRLQPKNVLRILDLLRGDETVYNNTATSFSLAMLAIWFVYRRIKMEPRWKITELRIILMMKYNLWQFKNSYHCNRNVLVKCGLIYR